MKINLLLLVFAYFGICPAAFANSPTTGNPIVNVSPKPSWILPCKPYNKKPSARDVENGAYDELVEEQINVGLKATYNHTITQIVSESGVQNNSEISVSFNPSYERIDFHEIVIWRNNKPQSRLDPASFKVLAEENEFDKFLYNGTYSAKYILADVRKGDRIEYSYTITGWNPIFDNKFCRTIYLQTSGLMMHQYTTLLFNTGQKLNMKSFNLLSQPRVSVVRGVKRYEWEDFQVSGVSTNRLQPKWFNQFARVEVSEFNSWASVVTWGMKINPLQINFTGELADTVNRLKKIYGSDKEKYFRAAVMFVQDGIRYMGIETGEYSHKANSPEKVFKQRYGDCKDKSLLLASILNANGIEAHLVLLNTDLETKLGDCIPSPIVFNHAVVVATISGKEVWADATISYQRGKGTDLYFPPYGEGLVLKAGNKTLTKIRETKTGKITCEEEYSVKDEYAAVKLNITTIYTLDQADEIRDHLASTGIAETQKDYLNYYSKTFNKIEAADSLIIKDDEDNNVLTTIERYNIRDFFKLDSTKGKFTANLYADLISDQLPTVEGEIKTPVSVSYPNSIDYTISIILPYGWDISDEHYSINRSAYKFTSDKIVNGKKLSLHYQFGYFRDYISQDQLPDFRKDIKELKDDQLGFNFYYIPDINRVPFRANSLIIWITLLVVCVFCYWGFTTYKIETRNDNFYSRNYYAPSIGGWLIVLVVVLFVSPLNFIKDLAEGSYYAERQWTLINTGVAGIMNKAVLVYEAIGYVALICYSVFCLVLVFKKRDIAPHYLKGYYLLTVIFLFVDCFFNAVAKGHLSNYDVKQIIEAVIVAGIWTYYLNVSSRVRETFVIPYPD